MLSVLTELPTSTVMSIIQLRMVLCCCLGFILGPPKSLPIPVSAELYTQKLSLLDILKS